MADIRIKDLTTLAPSAVSDDYLAIDGTTNGTRKLSAYSPSFGGNATVGGTLTVNSTDDASNKDTGSLVLEGGLGVEKNIIAGLGLSVRGAVTLPTAWTGAYGLGFEYGSAISRVFFGDGTGYTLKFVSRASSTTTDRMTLTDSGVLSVLGTTASTSTSSGALVVSGGVGVAGAIVSGGNIGIGNVNPVVAYTSTGSLLGSGDNPQVRLSATASSGWAFSTYGNTSATGKWSAGLNAGSQGYVITNDLDLSGTAALQILPTTFAATFGGALLATGTLTANAASNAFRIANSQTPASASATGTAGTIAWDASYIYVCTATNTWKRAAISTW